MSELGEKLKARKPQEITVTIDGDQYLVRGLSRVAKSKLFNSLVSGKEKAVAPDVYEAELLARCVLDPATFEPVLPDPNDWDIDAGTVAPLVEACTKVCGLDRNEVEAVKNSQPTDS